MSALPDQPDAARRDTETGACRQKLAVREHDSSQLHWTCKRLAGELHHSAAPAQFGREFPVHASPNGTEPSMIMLSKTALELGDTLEVAVLCLGSVVELWHMGTFRVLSL